VSKGMSFLSAKQQVFRYTYSKFKKFLLLLSLLLTASGYVPGGSGTTTHNTIQYTKNIRTQNNTYTLKTIHNTKITNNNTKLQTQCTKGNRSIKQYDKRNIHKLFLKSKIISPYYVT
jgi:hypothetical protein